MKSESCPFTSQALLCKGIIIIKWSAAMFGNCTLEDSKANEKYFVFQCRYTGCSQFLCCGNTLACGSKHLTWYHIFSHFLYKTIEDWIIYWRRTQFTARVNSILFIFKYFDIGEWYKNVAYTYSSALITTGLFQLLKSIYNHKPLCLSSRHSSEILFIQSCDFIQWEIWLEWK